MILQRSRTQLAAAFGSLKLRITLGGVGALMLGIGLTTALLVRQAERDTLAAQRQWQLAETVRTADALSRRIAGLQGALEATASRLDAATLADADRLTAFLDANPVLRGFFSNLFVAGTDGHMRVFVDAAGLRWPGVEVSDRPYFQRTFAEQRPIVSEAHLGRASGDPAVVLTYPLRSAGQVVGLLAGSLRLTHGDLLGDLAGEAQADAGALVVVTDTQGRILAHPNPQRLMQPLSTEPRLAQAFAHWVADGAAVEPAGLHLQQPGELVSVGGVPGADWIVWRAMPEAELFAPLLAARHQGLAWTGALIAIMSVAMLLLLRWLLRPLTQLEQRAAHLFDATHDLQLGWPDAGGEIGQLARVLRHVGAERAQLEAFNGELLRKLGSVMSAAPVGIAFTRAKRFELVSAELCRLLRHGEQALLGQSSQIMFVSLEDYQALGPHVDKAFGAGQPYAGVWEMLRADGSRFWARLRGRPVDPGDIDAGTIWTLADIDDQVAEHARLEQAATHDVLTGLANRKALDTRLAGVFEAMPRSLPAAIVMIDLDRFKPINDTAGHAAGDAMLRTVAAAITSCVRAGDLAVRLGGDEFCLLLERCAPSAALRIAENVRAAIANVALPWEQRTLRVGASLGLASLEADTPDAASWMQAADAACYRAKAEGRGVVRTAPGRVADLARSAA